MLRKYSPDFGHVLNIPDIPLDVDVSYIEHPVQILDRREKVLRSKVIPLVKVLWQHHGFDEAT